MRDQLTDLDVPGNTPDQGPPPRQVEAWTRVQGHVIARGRVSICSCGAWRSDRPDAGSLDHHIEQAWPVLVPLEDGDADLRAWARRVEEVWVLALEHQAALDFRDGHDKPTPPGGEIPVVTQEMVDAGCRVEVLEHQLNEIRSRTLRSDEGR